MSTHIQLNSTQVHDFQEIRDLGVSEITKITQYLEGIAQTPIDPNDLFEAIKSCTDSNESSLDSLMRQALSLNGLMRQMSISLSEVMRSLRFAIERDSGWPSNEVKAWDSVEVAFGNLMRLKAFRLAATTVDLSYEYANLFRSGKIITDIRPLFSENAAEIEGAVVSHTLRLRFESVDGNHELSIAMDQTDVKDVREQCERAIEKSRTAKKAMSEKAGIATLIVGEVSDA